MKNKLDITVIIPVHIYDATVEAYLSAAVQSVKDQSVEAKALMFVAPTEDILSQLKEKYGKKAQYVFNDTGKTDYCSQVNVGVEKTKTDLFSILEFDDQYSTYYFELVEKYVSSDDYEGFDAFLPTIKLVKEGKTYQQLTNNAVWAQEFSTKMGELDLTSTKEHDVFMLSGGVFKKDAFTSVGGLKGDIKIFFSKEFLLRFLHNNHRVMVIPRIGYKHLIGREDALFQTYKTMGMSQNEAKFYLDSARKEYLFNPIEFKREITYSSEEVG